MKYLLTVLVTILPMLALAQNDNIMYIYQDADLSSHEESSEVIQKGIELAFDEIGNEINGYRFEFKYLDHRANVVRSKRNYQTFIEDPKALAIFSGIHSPPLIKNREFINKQQALTLVPWAAGGPITRYPSSENWVFRLSVDDSQAGPFIINFALQKQGCLNPHLVLEETPWGESNLKSMSKALRQNNIDHIQVTRFSWNLKQAGASAIIRDVIKHDNDCIVLVANSREAIVIIHEISKLPVGERIPIISHWGVTAGNFAEVVSTDILAGLDLHFIQTCFSFNNAKQSYLASRVFTRLQAYTNGDITEPTDLKSAVGFIHAYDLTKLLIQAIRQTELSGEISQDRNAIRIALENIQDPVEGLVKTYQNPFSIFDNATNPNAHEALNAENYCMGKFGPKNEILIVGR